MKHLAIFLLTIYQRFVSQNIHSLVGVSNACRYSPTCSEYTKNAILTKGVIKGSVLGLRRLLSCQPFGKLSI